MGQFRSTPCTKKYTEEGSSTRLSYCATAMCGWRTYMQDSHIAKVDIGSGCSLFAVFDGHGGSQVAQYVTKIFVQTLVSSQEFKSKSYEKALVETYNSIDKILRSPEVDKQLKSMRQQPIQKSNQEQDAEEEQYDVGCTAVVCLITQTEIIVANAGDSRCMVSVGNTCTDLSFDHKPDNQIQLNRIKRAGGQIIQGRINGDINLSRAFGDFSFKSNSNLSEIQQQIICMPDVKSIPLQGVQYIILGCDGIFQKKTNQQITNLVQQKAKLKSLKETSEEILDYLLAPKSYHMSGKDNMTLVIIKVLN